MSALAIKYWVNTYNSLPQTKKLFDCRCDAIGYIKRLIDQYREHYAKEDLQHSYRLVEINPRLCPKWREIYLETQGA